MHRMLLLLLVSVCMGVFAVRAAVAQDAPPLIDREIFFGDPEIAGAQLSPDGQYITFRKPYNDVMNLWVKGIDEPFEAARPLTNDDRPVPGSFWTQDSRYVLYIQDKGGNENYHIYAVDPGAQADAETGVPSARNLTDYEDTRAQIYAVPESTPGQIMVGLNDRDAQWHDVYQLDIATGERTLVLENTMNLSGFQFDLDGDLRLATRTTDDGSTEVLRVDEGDALTSVYTCSVEETCYPVRFHKDGEQIYMVTNKGDRDLTALVLFDPQTMEETPVESDPEGEVDFGGAEFSDVTDELVATYYVGDRLRIYPKSEQLEADLATLRAKLPEGEIYLGSATEDETLHIVSVQRDVDPGSTYLYDRASGDVMLLYRSRPELPSEHLAPMEAVRYEARDGVTIPAYLTLPQGANATNLPVVILPHGGPWARDTWGYDSFTQFLANRGYAVFQPNFRGSTGYGKEFLNLGNGEWGTGTMQHDLTDGVQYLIDRGIADPDRVAIMGGSYGGYATLAGVTFTPDLYAAGVSIVGPSNLITLLNSIPPYWASVRKIFNVRMGDVDDPGDRARLEAQSPFFYADQIEAPLLVIQGANDPRVKQAESDQIVVAARENEVDVAYMVAPDEGHGFRGKENRLAMIAEIERFLAEHVGGRYQEEMSDELADHLTGLMVDVASVELPEMPEGADEAATADLPPADGSLLQLGALSYQTSLKVQGQDFNIDVTRSLVEDGETLRIIDATQTPMGSAVDTFFVDRSTLRPMRRSAQQGQGTMTMTYSDTELTGEMKMSGQSMPVQVTLDAPVVGDGGALDTYIVALPLEAGYTATVRTFSPMTQQVRPMRIEVTGTETVEVPAGSFETHVVTATPLDGEAAGTATYYVATGGPRFVVKSVTKMPAMMGGGEATSVLTAMPEGGSK